jgi:hypothetical protein
MHYLTIWCKFYVVKHLGNTLFWTWKPGNVGVLGVPCDSHEEHETSEKAGYAEDLIGVCVYMASCTSLLSLLPAALVTHEVLSSVISFWILSCNCNALTSRNFYSWAAACLTHLENSSSMWAALLLQQLLLNSLLHGVQHLKYCMTFIFAIIRGNNLWRYGYRCCRRGSLLLPFLDITSLTSVGKSRLGPIVAVYLTSLSVICSSSIMVQLGMFLNS